jgi:hypothetical protein
MSGPQRVNLMLFATNHRHAAASAGPQAAGAFAVPHRGALRTPSPAAPSQAGISLAREHTFLPNEPIFAEAPNHFVRAPSLSASQPTAGEHRPLSAQTETRLLQHLLAKRRGSHYAGQRLRRPWPILFSERGLLLSSPARVRAPASPRLLPRSGARTDCCTARHRSHSPPTVPDGCPARRCRHPA